MNADSIIDNRGVITQNLFAYCGNNPVNNTDPDGHLFGALVGGIIGGILGGLTAAASGKSIAAGIVTGALTGAAIGYVCDMAIPVVVAAAACAGIAAIGNVANQAINYGVEKKQYNQKQRNGTNKPLIDNSNQVSKKYQSFANYIDTGSIATSAIAAAVCAPLAVAGGTQVNNIFDDLAKSGINTASRFIAEWAIGTNVSVLQTSVEYIIPIFEQ